MTVASGPSSHSQRPSRSAPTPPHRHHAYWRFDFDLDGTPANDEILEIQNDIPQILTNESSRTWLDAPAETHWQVRDADTGFGYTIEPSETDLLLPVDAYSKTDALALRYRENELGDGEGLCDFDFGPLANNESLDGEDVVFWYRSSALHGAGNPYECDIVGPTLRPFGMIEPLPADQPAEIEAAQAQPVHPTNHGPLPRPNRRDRSCHPPRFPGPTHPRSV